MSSSIFEMFPTTTNSTTELSELCSNTNNDDINFTDANIQLILESIKFGLGRIECSMTSGTHGLKAEYNTFYTSPFIIHKTETQQGSTYTLYTYDITLRRNKDLTCV